MRMLPNLTHQRRNDEQPGFACSNRATPNLPFPPMPVPSLNFPVNFSYMMVSL